MLPAPAMNSHGIWGISAAVGIGDVASNGIVTTSPTNTTPASVDGAPICRLARAEDRVAIVQMTAVRDPR